MNTLGQTGGGTPSLGAAKPPPRLQLVIRLLAPFSTTVALCAGDSIGSPNLGGKTATKIALGEEHACAILNDKTVKCWGGGR